MVLGGRIEVAVTFDSHTTHYTQHTQLLTSFDFTHMPFQQTHKKNVDKFVLVM